MTSLNHFAYFVFFIFQSWMNWYRYLTWNVSEPYSPRVFQLSSVTQHSTWELLHFLLVAQATDTPQTVMRAERGKLLHPCLVFSSPQQSAAKSENMMCVVPGVGRTAPACRTETSRRSFTLTEASAKEPTYRKRCDEIGREKGEKMMWILRCFFQRFSHFCFGLGSCLAWHFCPQSVP